MTFTEFLDEVVDRIPEYLLQYDIEKVCVNTVEKNNGVMATGIAICIENSNVSPNIYMEYFYDLLNHGKSMEEILDEIAREYRDSLGRIANESYEINKEHIEEKIFMKLVNYEKNKVLLEKAPYIPFFDLAITFRYIVGKRKEGLLSAQITNKEMDMLDLSMEQLVSYAGTNTERLFPSVIKKITEVIQVPESIDADDVPLYVLSNDIFINGATCMVYKNIIRDFARQCGMNLFIIPSSVHEVLLTPVENEDRREELTELVRSVNETILNDMDYLSDRVYYYNLETDSLI